MTQVGIVNNRSNITNIFYIFVKNIFTFLMIIILFTYILITEKLLVRILNYVFQNFQKHDSLPI